MHILDLYIRNNKRLMDKKTNVIHWTIHSDVQLLIGGNGFGKSTLQNEFSPLPANPKHYLKTGCKKVLVEHESKRYRLESDFGKKHKHSFFDIEQDKELNDGGTVTVQMDLCKRILGYDNEIHNFLKGKVKLTTMSSKERKDFFSKVSDVPIDFALKVYDSLRVEARNLAGVQKYNKQKVFDETKKLLSDEKKKEFQDEIVDLKATVAELTGARFNNHSPAPVHIQDLHSKIDKMSDYIVSNHLTYTGYSSIAELEAEIQTADKQKTSCSDKLRFLLEKMELHKRKLEFVNSVTEYPTAKVKEDLFELKEQIETVEHEESLHDLSLVHDFRDKQQIEIILRAFEEAKRTLQESLITLPVNVNKNMADESLYIHVQNKRSQAVTALNELDNEIQNRRATITHIESHDSVTCEECNHVFTPGVDVKSIPRLKQTNEQAAVEMEAFELKIKKCDDKLAELRDYRMKHENILRSLNHYNLDQLSLDIDSNPCSVRTFITTDELYFTSPSSLAPRLDKIHELIKVKVKWFVLKEKHDHIASILQHRERLGITDEDAQYTTEVVKTLENEYHETANLHASFTDTFTQLTKMKNRLGQERTQQQQLMEMVKKLNHYYVDSVKSKVNSGIDEKVNELSMKLYRLNETLTSCSITEGIIDHLENALKQVDDDIIIYAKLIEKLGPQKGLIGKSLISFTNYFIERMNEVIAAIWTTPLSVMPMTVSEKGFSYMFPVVTYLESNASEDVSGTSSGEAEIIDFAFMLITASCLGLSNYPLLLDEVGKYFKLEHKVRLYDYLKLLSEHNKASTIVLISHFKGTYEALTRADVCRIDPTGLEIQDHENKFFNINPVEA